MSSIKEKKLRKYASDLLALHRYLLSAVKKQQSSDKVTQKEAIELFYHLNLKLSEQTVRLQSRVEALGGDFKENAKSKLAGFSGSIAALVDTVRKDSVSKMVRDDYIALSMLAAGYKMLHTTALIAHEEELVKLTQEHLTTLTQLITESSKVLPMIVARELSDDSAIAEEIGSLAVNNTQKAWSVENIHSEPEVIES